MKSNIFLLAVALCVSGCATMPPVQTNRVMPAKYVNVWDATVKTLSKEGFKVTAMDRNSGMINATYGPYETILTSLRKNAIVSLSDTGADKVNVTIHIEVQRNSSRFGEHWEQWGNDPEYSVKLLGQIEQRLLNYPATEASGGEVPSKQDALAAIRAKRAEPAVIPPRTIDAAQQQFNDQGFVAGKTTVADMQSALGSPSEIRKESNGERTHIYIKNVYSTGVTVDVGTSYIGEYTFDSNGLFKEKNLLARPMSNPLLR